MKRFLSIVGLMLISAVALAATSTAFMPATTTKTIAASASSASVIFADNDMDGDCLRIFNSTSAVAYLKYGHGTSLTATTADLAIAPGGVEVLNVGQYTNIIAVVLSTSSGSVYVTKGSGL